MRASAQNRKRVNGGASVLAAAFLVSVASVSDASAQTASGVVNDYASVTSIGGSTVNVSTTTGFNVGDRKHQSGGGQTKRSSEGEWNSEPADSVVILGRK